MVKNNKILEAINRGIQLALDDFEDIENNNSVSQLSDVINSDDVIKNKIEFNKFFVDMGFPSGTIWAKYNLGVNPYRGLFIPQSYYGNYYAWGETKPKNNYDWRNYKFISSISPLKFKKYNGNRKDRETLDLRDDAAFVNNPYSNINVRVCLPTPEQIIELQIHTDRELVHNYKGIAGLNVVILTSRCNGKKLMFPLGGFKDEEQTKYVGETGFIMSKYMDKQYNHRAYGISFQIKYTGGKHLDFKFDYIGKKTGVNVRPVIMK